MWKHASLNRRYRLVWNHMRQCWNVAPEIASGQGRAASAGESAQPACILPLRALAVAIGCAFSLSALALDAGALPTGGTVVAGQASLSQSGSTLTVNQSTDRAILEWQSFNIGKDAAVHFNQNSASSVALNRVTGGTRSEIYGSLTANGQVYLVNSAGVLFGNTAQVDVGGIVASTLDISNDDFLAGKNRFVQGSGTGEVINQGSITARDGGTVALIGSSVSNTGQIVANGGNVALAAGQQVTFAAGANGHLQIAVDASEAQMIVNNGGLIQADGGQVILTAQGANALASAVVSNTGTVQARTVAEREGKILLLADFDSGTTNVAGTLDASAPEGGNGGFIETSAAHVKVAQETKVTTKAENGKTGTWLIDPTDFTVSAGNTAQSSSGIGADTLANNLATTDVTLQTAPANTGSEAGDIHVNAAVTWNAGTTLTLSAHNNININAAITAQHADGKVALKYGQSSANGGTADYFIKAPINLQSGQNFSTQKGSGGATLTYTVVNDANALQAMNNNFGGNYAVGSNINLGGIANWVPVGSDPSHFTGRLAGLGHTLNNLTIDRPSTDYVGLFGIAGGDSVIRDIGLVGGNVVGSTHVGGLVGWNVGSISNVYATGSVRGAESVGGLVGTNQRTISNAYATGSVTASNFIGGLVGWNRSGDSISNAYATGSVTGINYVGGLVGANDATISNAYATGSVTGFSVGGLVGFNRGSITSTYATGSVTGTGSVGGLIGRNNNGSVSNSFYATTDATGNAINNGGATAGAFSGNTHGTGKTWLDLTNPATFTGWDTSLWTLTGAGSSVAGYGVVLPYLTSVTRAADIVSGTLFQGGQGTAGNPYTLTTWQHLAGINRVLRGGYTFNLLNDLGSSTAGYGLFASATANGGLGWNPLGTSSNRFTGTFAGQGHTISDLNINRSTDYVGLFGYTGSSVIRGIGLVGGSIKGQNSVGALVGWNEGSISNAYATGSVTGINEGVGGLVGYNSGSISNAYATGSVSGSWYVGGIVGFNYNGTIGNAYATGSVTGGGGVGGLVGYDNNGSISNSFYATSNATGSVINNGGATTGVFRANVYGTGKTWLDLTNPATFTGWDTSVWTLTGAGSSVAGYGVVLPYLTSVTRTADIVRGILFQGGQGSAGNPYTLTTWQQLAGINHVTGGSYTFTLLNDLNSSTAGYSVFASATANGGLGWNPLGTINNTFTGTFDGQSHKIGDVVINRSGTDSVGLFGYTRIGSVIRNIGLVDGRINGRNQVGGLVGVNTGSISNAYFTGSVSGASNRVGGLVGFNDYYGSIDNAYAVGNVQGYGYVGGLVGLNVSGSVNAAYASGNVMGNQYVGGLVGYNNSGNISNAYATASVSGSLGVGGLIGFGANVASSFYATTDANGNTINNGASSTGAFTGNTTGIGKTWAELTQLSTFTAAGWDIDDAGGTSNTWRIYDGYTTPLLRSFLTAVNVAVDLDARDKTYDGSVASGTASYTTSLGSGLNASQLLGNLSYASTDKNAGTYSTSDGTLGISNPLYSTQQGYDISYSIGSNTLTIEPKALSIATTTAADKTYDGTTGASLTAGILAGLVGAETLGVSAIGEFDSANAGSRTATAHYTLADGSNGGLAANYTLADTNGHAATINKSALTISTGNVSKTYDGTTSATGTAVIAGGTLFGSDSLSGGSFAFTDINAGSNKTVTTNGVTVSDGNNGGNYDVTYADNTSSTIDKASITVATSDVTKTYDGTTSAAGSAVLVGGTLFNSDSLSGGSFAFTDINAGTGKTVTASGVTVSDGNNGGNYDVTYANNTGSTIDKASITVSTSDVSKTYDGSLSAIGSVVLTGGTLFNSDSLSGGTFSFTDANAGTNKTVITSSVTVSDGNSGGNYAVTYVDNTSSTTDKASITVTANGGSSTYGDIGLLNPGISATGLANGETVAVLTGLSNSFGIDNTTNVGSYALSVNGTLTNGNYVVSQTTDGTWVVDRKTLTVKANDDRRSVSSQAYSGGNGVTYSGFVNGESSSVLLGSLAYGGTAQGASRAGTYTLSVSGLSADNYALQYVDGRLLLTAPLTTPGGGELARPVLDGLSHLPSSLPLALASSEALRLTILGDPMGMTD